MIHGKLYLHDLYPPNLPVQKLDTIIRSLAERSQALDGMLDSTDAAGKHIIVLEQQVCESIAQGTPPARILCHGGLQFMLPE